MSAEDLINSAPTDIERAPAPDSYVPMAESVSEDPRKKEYSGERDGLEAAARDLDKAREASQPAPQLATDENGIVQRNYIRLNDGSPIPLNETVTPKRAAADLTAVREADIAALSPTVGEVANAVDQVRADYHGQQQLQVEQPQPQQPDPQAQQAAEWARAAEQQGIDPEIAQAIANPKIRAALEAEISQVETARGQYAQAALQAAQLAGAATFAAFPELANLSAGELPTAIRLIAARDPARAQAIEQHVQRTQALYQASQQAAAQQQQIAAQRMASWAQNEDQRFEQSIARENPETVRAVRENVVSVLETEYGIDKNELKQLWDSQPLLRTAAAQRLLFDVTRMKLAERDVANKRHNPIPQVQRPGTSQPKVSHSDGEIAAALKLFNSDPNPKNAAALLVARRNARR